MGGCVSNPKVLRDDIDALIPLLPKVVEEEDCGKQKEVTKDAENCTTLNVQEFWNAFCGLFCWNGVLERYPSKLLSTTIQIVISTVQTFVVAVIFERDFDQWKLGWNFQLLAVVYCSQNSPATENNRRSRSNERLTLLLRPCIK
nr:WAT1-related protein At5g64700-like [Ipomoea batatas]